jgi:mono/diheme cytochrome c family protein
MVNHYDIALELRDHAIAGDLTRARATARTLAELETTADLPPSVLLQLGPTRHEAEVMSDARTVEAAAQGAAEVAGTCGACHLANDVELPPAIPGPTPGSATDDLEAHMEGLSRVTRRLWAGLIAPNEEDWQTGAADLIAVGGLPSGLEGLVPARDVDLAARRLTRLAEEAASAHEDRYRVRALGEIWGTCAECHVSLEGGARH